MDAVVIGAGPAGLAAAAELQKVGYSVIVIDKADSVGSSWSKHYDRLHLHTSRALSSLPGRRIPRSFGQWVARDDFRTYLADYAKAEKLDVRLGVTASAITKNDAGWTVASSIGDLAADAVVVATGYNHTAKIPDWPGLETYRGRVVHSSEYRNPQALAAQDVLVVGPGNSGAEIAADLAAAGVTVRLAVRSPPNIVRRQVLGIPTQSLTLSTYPLPTKMADRVARGMQILTVGDLSKYGLQKAPRGVFSQQEFDDVTPTIDVGLIDALKAGAITVVGAVESFTADSVTLAGGASVSPEVVLVATGFQRGLEPLVGELGVIAPGGRPLINAEEQLPGLEGLFFLGYSNPITGNIRQVAIDAKKIGKRARPER
ncbi:MAG: Monooxygenase [Rhodoglobus sp.]|jgi:putative flavoprotein involved in K+ transport|nr:Monooxygenase [Rhodoglobus sp.]